MTDWRTGPVPANGWYEIWAGDADPVLARLEAGNVWLDTRWLWKGPLLEPVGVDAATGELLGLERLS